MKKINQLKTHSSTKINQKSYIFNFFFFKFFKFFMFFNLFFMFFPNQTQQQELKPATRTQTQQPTTQTQITRT